MSIQNIVVQRKKEGRGDFLTLMITIHLIVVIGIFVFLLNQITASNIPENIIIFLLVLTLPLIWKWKSIGFFGLIVALLLLVYDGMIRTDAISLVGLIIWPYLLFSLLYFWAIARKLHLFNLW